MEFILFSNYSRLVDVVKSVLSDQFIQQWECEMNLSHKGKTYKMMKGPLQTEKYFTNFPIILQMKYASLEHPIINYQSKLEDSLILIMKRENVTCAKQMKLEMIIVFFGNAKPYQV